MGGGEGLSSYNVLIESLHLLCCFRMHKVNQQCFRIYLQMDLYLRPWLILRYGIEAVAKCSANEFMN